MTGMSSYSGVNWLAYITGKTGMPATPTAFVALFTTAPTDDTGTGAVEVSGGSYARVTTTAANWNTPSAISGSNPTETPNTTSNAQALTFTTATANWGTVIAFGLYDALTTGNLLAWDYLGNFSWLPCTVSTASPGVITAKAHGYSAADNVIFSTEYGGTMPRPALYHGSSRLEARPCRWRRRRRSVRQRHRGASRLAISLLRRRRRRAHRSTISRGPTRRRSSRIPESSSMSG